MPKIPMMQNDEILLLQVSQFLTKFQDYFRGEDELLNIPISRSTVRKAIEYEKVLEERNLVQSLRRTNETKEASVKNKSSLDTRMKEIEEQIDKISPHIRYVNRMIKRFAVLTTQDVAQCLLMGEESSPLLNLPNVAYANLEVKVSSEPLRRRLNNEPYISPSKTLLLPPNHWTWQEYLRLAFPVALLPTESARRKTNFSTVTSFSLDKRENLRTTGRLSQSELVALWIRSQRNTSAWRHLTQLFIFKKQEKKSEKKLLQQHSTDCDENDHIACFAGNSARNLSNMVRKDAKQIDALVEWAILNQVLFTQEYIESGITSGSIPHTSKKIKENDLLSAVKNNPASAQAKAASNLNQNGRDHKDKARDNHKAKRSLESQNECKAQEVKKQKLEKFSEEEELSILLAKRSFLLRWFARRNRKVTTILFGNKIEYDLLPAMYHTYFRDLYKSGVLDRVKETLRSEYKSTNRTFARIDRRLQKANNYASKDSYFQDSVLQCLRALQVSINTDGHSNLMIDNAIKDFQLLHEHFLCKNHIEEIIKRSTPTNMIRQLSSVQPPWTTRCHACENALEENQVTILCSNCEKSMHDKCCVHRSKISLQDLITNFEPLQQLFMIRIPLAPDLPDFVSKIKVEWTKIQVKVLLTPNRGLRVGVQHTEECHEKFQQLLSGKMVASFLKNTRRTPPFCAQQRGLIVTEFLEDSPAIEAGVKLGDFITHVQERGKSTFTDLSTLDQMTRIELFKQMKDPTSMIIQRPDKPILEISREWFKALQKKANKSLKKVFDTKSMQTFCRDCVVNSLPNTERSPVEEAKRCLAVVRRLGMESYSLPFHEEKPFTNGDSHYFCISFRRLDEMMLSIINSEALTAKGYGWPFSVPPHHAEGGNSAISQPLKLDWISERLINSPYELLCRGMQIILTPPICFSATALEDKFSQERAVLASHFLSLFTTWCLRTSFDIGGCIATSGPPTDYLSICKPWVDSTCKYCMLPITIDTTNFESVSCKRECCKAKNESTKNAGPSNDRIVLSLCSDSELDEPSPDLNDQNCRDSSNEDRLRRYHDHASYVGSILTILPGDPLLDIPAYFLQQDWIKASDRPVPFLVASYLPWYFVDIQPGSCIKPSEAECDSKSDGVFYLLPVLTSKQLLYLQSIAFMRSQPRLDEGKMSKKWSKMEILSLQGVVCLTSSQLLRRVSQTKTVINALANAIAIQASCTTQEELDSIPREQNVSESRIIFDSSDEGHSTASTSMESNKKFDFQLKALSKQLNGISSDSKQTEDVATKLVALIDCSVDCGSKRIHNLLNSLDDTDYDVAAGQEKKSSRNLVRSEDSKIKEKPRNIGNSKARAEARKGTNVIDLSNEEISNGDDAKSKSIKSTSQPAQLNPESYRSVRTRNNQREKIFTIGDTAAASTASVPAVPRTAESNSQFRYFQKNDLYRAGPPNTFVSLAEAVVVKETLLLGYPKLAARILVPRYTYDNALEQVNLINQISDWSTKYPHLPPNVVKEIWSQDYKRTKDEDGPIIAWEGECAYRLPRTPLPLDLLLSHYLYRNGQNQVQLNQQEITQRHSPPAPAHFQRGVQYANPGAHTLSATQNQFNSGFVHQLQPHHHSPPRWQPYSHDPSMEYGKGKGEQIDQGGSPARIRGGRPNDDNSVSSAKDKQLDAHSRGKLVTAKINTTKDGGRPVEATVIGYFQERSRQNNNMADVNVIYVSSHGILNDPAAQKLPIDILKSVEEGSEEAAIEKAWRENRHTLANAAADFAAVTGKDSQNTIAEDVREKATVQGDPQRSTQSSVSPLSNDSAFTWKWTNRESDVMLLGHLPDSRGVYWFLSEPGSLFVRYNGETSQINAAQIIAASNAFAQDVLKGGRTKTHKYDYSSLGEGINYCCFWGCSSYNSGKLSLTSFQSEAELQEHLSERHKYHTSSIGNSIFVLDGEQIQAMASDLVGSITARWPPLSDLMKSSVLIEKESSANLLFDRERLRKVMETNNGHALNEILQDYPGDKDYVRQMVRLWSKIAALFDLEQSGKPIECQKDQQTKIPNMKTFGTVKGTDSVVIDACYEGMICLEQLQFNQCQLCCSGSERCVKNNATSELLSLGCSLISSLGYNFPVSSMVCHGHNSSFSMAKTILLHIAITLPRALRLEERPSIGIKQSIKGTAQLSQMLWDDGRFQYWCSFVESSENMRRLTQALVVLLGNVNKTRLPAWWKSVRAGWSKPAALVGSPLTVSAFLLHLYVLDAAIAEFQKHNKVTDGREKLLKSSISQDVVPKTKSVAERMKSVISWAEKLGIEQITEGVHGDACVTCDDGGELLCCEFCPTVQHAACADPPIEDPNSLNQWVCSACTKDIAELKEASF